MIYAANWKLYKTPEEARAFATTFIQEWSPSTSDQVMIFPPALSAAAVAEVFKGSKIGWGLQNAYFQGQGAFTGENSAVVAQQMGAQFVLVGHSERRSLFGEGNEFLAQKIQFLQAQGLTPVFCIGETLAEREGHKTQSVLIEQIRQGLKHADKNKALIVAYEPVWAIGTGKVATPAQVAETHQWIVEILKDHGFEKLPLLYGGSVKPENAAELKAQKNVDGFLIGGASLEVKSFMGIIQAQ